MATTLTAPQAKVLRGVIAAGGVALHLQTGRTQAVIRKLIEKGLLAIKADDGRVGPTATHYGFEAVRALAVDIGGGWSRATLTLVHGDTVWNPYSTKYYFAGEGTWTFLFHPSSIEVESTPEDYHRVSIAR